MFGHTMLGDLSHRHGGCGARGQVLLLIPAQVLQLQQNGADGACCCGGCRLNRADAVIVSYTVSSSIGDLCARCIRCRCITYVLQWSLVQGAGIGNASTLVCTPSDLRDFISNRRLNRPVRELQEEACGETGSPESANCWVSLLGSVHVWQCAILTVQRGVAYTTALKTVHTYLCLRSGQRSITPWLYILMIHSRFGQTVMLQTFAAHGSDKTSQAPAPVDQTGHCTMCLLL